MNWQKTISEFVSLIHDNKIEVYNEASVQFELAIFLRGKFPNRIVNLERNVNYFDLEKRDGYCSYERWPNRKNQRMLTKSRLSSMLIPCVIVRSLIFQPKSAAKS